MNWIERLYEIKGRDLYSQNGEGLILEYVCHSLGITNPFFMDIGGGDGFYLSNTRHLANLGSPGVVLDRENGVDINLNNITDWVKYPHPSMLIGRTDIDVLSIDIDGNDYWILDKILSLKKPSIIIAEFNAMYTDSRAIAYNHNHVWAGDSYYGFTFEAGKKLAEKHGYKIIFQIADMNILMVHADLITGLTFPEVTYKQNDYFKLSERTDWIFV